MEAGKTWQRAEKLRMAGDTAGARGCYAELVRLPAAAAYAHLRLADMALAGGDLRLATSHVLQAYDAAHAEPSLLAQLCRQLFALGEVRAGLDAAERLARAPHAGIAMLAEIAKLLSDAMQPEAALAMLARARERGLQTSAGESYLEGLNRLYLGELDRAFAALTTSITLDPAFAPAYWGLAKLRSPELRQQRIDRLDSLLARHPDTHPDAPLWLYSLFHELDAEDEVTRAWPVLLRAMRARSAQVRYDEVAELALLKRLRDGMQGWAAHALAAGSEDGDASRPVMIVGLPRTGTTLIEQSLCGSWEIQGAGELRDFVQQMRWMANAPGPPSPDALLIEAIDSSQLHQLGQRYLAHAAWRGCGLPHFSDKWPENYLIIGQALASLPQLTVVAVQRDAMDSCWSNLREWFGSSYYYSYDIGQVARRQVAYASLLDAARDAFGERVTVAEYERFVQDPLAEGRRLAGAVGLHPRIQGAPAVRAVATASAVQVRAGVTTRNIGAWRRYERWLTPLQAALEEAQRIDGSNA